MDPLWRHPVVRIAVEAWSLSFGFTILAFLEPEVVSDGSDLEKHVIYVQVNSSEGAKLSWHSLNGSLLEPHMFWRQLLVAISDTAL